MINVMNFFRIFFLVTSLIANALWVVALIAQGLTTAKFGHSSVGTLWFAIGLQLLVNVGGLCTLLNRSADLYRSQLSHFAVLAVVFAAIGIDANIYAEQAVRQLVGASWLILLVVDILWIGYFSADPQSRVWKVFHPEPTVIPVATHSNSPPTSIADLDLSSRKSHSAVSQTLNTQQRDGTETTHTVTSRPITDDSGLSSEVWFSHKARACYDYSASTSSAPNEFNFQQVSFKKGDILDVSRIVDKKWWPARTQDGKQGIAPSNYLQIITESSTE
ncbi:hypothetical protein E1B28_011962 [Marasmius oreades]|uniref:SH3 domain-containing protein n=1 Tax=Marasmius oreades TaxID=181124 RepID=A0A9P7RRT9_9AGAR|nr:uncharacterized protein E1B28_011962 [Marasmius oreades]KAG7087913.1 hypothetical protein E1B28_011962 [Marasmius oreades]